VRALVDVVAAFAPAPGDAVRWGGLVAVRGDRAVLAPRRMRRDVERLEPLLHRAGVRLVDAPLVLLDGHSVVVPEPELAVDREALAEADALDDRIGVAAGEPVAVGPGGYRVAGWLAFAPDGTTAGPATGATGVSALLGGAAGLGDEGRSLGDALDALAAVVRASSGVRLHVPRPRDVAAAVVDLLSSAR
jgi:hypothetical protein